MADEFNEPSRRLPLHAGPIQRFCCVRRAELKEIGGRSRREYHIILHMQSTNTLADLSIYDNVCQRTKSISPTSSN